MRPYLLAAALLAATPLTPASAAACLATAQAPSGDPNVIGTGSLTCTASFPGMAVTVCLESLHVATFPGWHADLCSTRAAGAGATSVSETVVRCYGETVLVRTTAYGTDDAGRQTSATSAPVLVFGVGSCGP